MQTTNNSNYCDGYWFLSTNWWEDPIPEETLTYLTETESWAST